MNIVKKLLVPFDFSTSASAALRRAVQLAAEPETTIHLLHVADVPTIMNSNSDVAGFDEMQAIKEKEIVGELNSVLKNLIPGGAIKTVVLFFTKGEPTSKVWFYQLDPKRSLGKTSPLVESDLAEFVKLSKMKADSEQSWTVEVSAIDEKTFDLSVRNPNRVEQQILRSADSVIDELESLDRDSIQMLEKIRGLL
jgi:type I restriction enzyme M protein